ncbi:MAG: hypothetical protein KDC87_22355, partial [Planctomycetes bacterium]|nr:hypothetical protein [Planctomycetota bacterium]
MARRCATRSESLRALAPDLRRPIRSADLHSCSKLALKILFFGTSDYALPSLRAMVEAGFV